MHVRLGPAETAPSTRAPKVAPLRQVDRVLALQRVAGNAAVVQLLRAPGGGGRVSDKRAKVVHPPGKGYDGLQGHPISRNLNDAQKQIVGEFRGRIAGKAGQGTWAREAAGIAARYHGSALERAALYAELQRQMIQVDISWGAKHIVGKDGSHIFYGSLGRMFVVAPDGQCYVGMKGDLIAHADGKVPAYDKLKLVPSAAPAAASPAAAGAAAESAAGKAAGKAAGGAEGAVAGRVARLGFWKLAALQLAAELLIEAAVAWLTYEKNVGNPKVAKYRKFLGGKLNGPIALALQSQEQQAKRMSLERPDLPVHAVVTYDLYYKWSRDAQAAHGVSAVDLDYRDAKVVEVKLAYRSELKEETLSKETDFRDRTDRRRVTVSMEINPFDESREVRRWRALIYEAGQVAERRIPARRVAESQHYDIELTVAEEREERRRKKFGLPSLYEEKVRAEQLQWVAAYIEYTSAHDRLKQLYDDAIAYYTDLEARDRRATEVGAGCLNCAPAPPARPSFKSARR